MTYFIIPAGNTLPYYKFKITLSSVTYTLNFRYNGRMARWILEIQDPSGNQILSGLPILIQRSLTGQYSTLAVPIGTIFATDDTGKDTQPTQYSFGTDHTLWYGDPSQ